MVSICGMEPSKCLALPQPDFVIRVSLPQIEELMDLVAENDLLDVPVICGGNIPPSQIENLAAKGVAKFFPPGSSGDAIIDYLAANGRSRNEGLH